MMRGWILSMMLIAACKQQDVSEHILSNKGKDASCAHITGTADGKTVISWIETEKGAETGMLYYAVSANDTFSAPLPVTTSTGVLPHAENMPKMVFKPDGEVIAMYGVEQNDARNKYAGRVLYTRSPDGGKTWLTPQSLVADTGSYDQRYFDMTILPNGEAAAIWLDNRKHTNDEGSTLYYAVTDGHDGFKQEKPLAETVCQCCRTALYTDTKGDIHIAFRDIINDSIRDMVHMVSTDGGASFSTHSRISADNWVVRGCPHTGPAMVRNGTAMHFAWFTMGGGQGVFYCRSLDNGKTYTQKEPVSTAPMAKHPQITALGDKSVMMVWDEPVKVVNNFNYRIGFQKRNKEGEVLETGLLTSDSSYSTFPVIKAMDDSRVLVAYTKKAGELEEVVYRFK
ncbi:hypothetical protein GCM10022209_14110 [Chitinophaga oryziterrae]